MDTCRSELVRESVIPDAKNASTVPPSSRTSSLPQKLVDTCRSELVRESVIPDAENASTVDQLIIPDAKNASTAPPSSRTSSPTAFGQSQKRTCITMSALRQLCDSDDLVRPERAYSCHALCAAFPGLLALCRAYAAQQKDGLVEACDQLRRLLPTQRLCIRVSQGGLNR
ncbi:hypothetical protein BV349_01784 [Pseudomonas syringae pv. actinidiae]|nr:hypothetical protein BV349_01784 [Pseudomonas syringae pv. actinidiae]OSN77961.1 hypothetical protein BV351_01708 [Pseudomonas syringae pv. actinidiae]RMR94379.1 hypothetical protein ALP75_202074 [Pseudomonas syringae pv. actinidiae]